MGYISLDQVKKYKSEEDSIFSQETINNFSYDEERLKDLDKKINVISESSYLKNLQVKEKDRENKFARFVGDVSKVSWEVAKSLSKEAVQFPKKFGEEVQKQGGGIGGLTKTTTKLATDMLVGGVKKVGEDLAFYGGKGIHQFINKTDGLGEKQLTQLKNQGYISDISWNPYTNLLIWEENQHAMADSAFEMSKRAKTPELKKKYLAEAQRIRNEILPNAGNKEEAKGLYETKTNAVILDRMRNRTKAQVLADFAEAGLDIATLGIGGKIVKKAGTEAIEQVSKQVLKKGAGEVTEQVGKGILKKAGQETLKEAPSMIAQGVGYGAVGAIQEGETDISNIASSGVVGGVIGGVVGSGLNFGLQGILPFMGYSVGKHLEKLYPNDKYVAQEVSQRYINNVSQRIEKSLSKYIDVDKIIVPTKGDIDLQYRKLDTITQILQLDGVAVGGRVLDIPEANMADLSAIKKNIMGETMDKLYDGKEVQLGELEDVLFKAKEALKEHGLEITSNKIYPTPVTALVDEKISVGIEPTETDLKAVAIEFENGTGAIEEVIDKTTSQVDNQITNKLRSDTKIEDLDGRKVGYTIDGKQVEGVVQGDVLKLSDEFGGRAIPITPEVKQNIIKTADVLEGVTREIPVKKAEVTDNLLQEARKYKSAEEFVKAQGTPIFHGTASKFEVFDPKFQGYSTGAESAKGAFWFTDDLATANAIYAAEDVPVNKLYEEAEKLEKIAQRSGKESDWKKYDALVAEAEKLAEYDATYQRRLDLANVKEAYVKGDFLEVDAKGKTPQELSSDENIDSWLNSKVKEAQAQGKAGLKITNIDDAVNLANRPSTHYAVFNPDIIKTKSQLEDIWNKANQSIDQKYRTPNEVEPKIMEKLGIDAGDEPTMKDMEQVNFEMANREKNKAQQEITKRQIEIYDRQKELQKEIQMVSEYFSDTDVKEKYKLLWKHVDKRNWELPEILGKGKSIFGKKGDVIISEYFGGDEVAAQKFIDDYRAMVQKRKDLNAEKIQLDREMITLERSRPIDELSGFGEEKVSRFFERTKKDKYDIGHLVDENGNVTEKSVLYIESKVKGSEQNANYLADTNYDVALEVANGDRHSKDVFLDIKVGLEVAKREYEAGNIEVAGEITERLSLEGTKAGKLIKALDNGGSQFQPDKVIRQVVRSRLKNAGGMNEVQKVTRSVKEGIMKAIKIDKKTFNSILDKYTC